jgi:hypothetical protein
MDLLRTRFRGIGLACVVGVWAMPLLARAALAQQDGPRVSRVGLPSTPVYSKDGTVVVYAPSSKAGYRAPVLVFVDRTREELRRTTRLKLGSQACVLEIALGGKSDGDTRVLASRLRDREGGLHERIELPDPEAADLSKFRRALCVALLRSWMVDAGGTEATMREPPAWLFDGVIRYMDHETRQADLDRMLLLWSHACLPSAVELFAADSLAATREPAVAAMLVNWFLEKRPNINSFEALLRGAATGTAWRPEGAGLLLAGTDQPAAFDAALDRWLLSEGRVVIKPGLTTAGIVRRFRAHLLLYPADYGKTLDASRPWLTFHEVVALADDPAVRSGVAEKEAPLRAAAFGRDGMLLAVSEAYVAFMTAFARGEKQGELSRLLMEAEGMRKELEHRTAQGAVLQRTVEGNTAAGTRRGAGVE